MEILIYILEKAKVNINDISFLIQTFSFNGHILINTVLNIK